MLRRLKALLSHRRDCQLLAECLLLVVVVRLGLTFASFKFLRRHMLSKGALDVADPAEARRIAWCIKIVARFVPKASCLTQALAGQVAFARRRLATQLQIGVDHLSSGQLLAHAWLKSGDEILLGGTEDSLKGFVPLISYGPTA